MAEKKKYYWIKLKNNFFEEPAIDFLLSQKNGCEYIVLYQMICLKTSNNSGALAIEIGEMIVPFDAEKITRDTKYFDVDTVLIALELYKKLGLIYESQDGVLTISNFEEMVGSETEFAKKKREYRKKVGQSNGQQIGHDKGQKEDIVRQEIEYRDRDKSLEKDIEKDVSTTTIEIEKIINSLNEHIKHKTDASDELTVSAIRELLNKGFSFADFPLVINHKCEELKDDKEILTAFNIVNPKYFSYNLNMAKVNKEEVDDSFTKETFVSEEVDDDNLNSLLKKLEKGEL